MESMRKECTELKQNYEDCFNQWYADVFLQQTKDNRLQVDENNNEPCKELFDEYRACIIIALREKKLDQAIDKAKKQQSNSNQ
ncbi:hypothetical protein MIR68_008768 [Amoeboaphelidium protococcarum]|nr:hypothetical protein MIR68_008768 [Amoeboaphelidium protococcarum]